MTRNCLVPVMFGEPVLSASDRHFGLATAPAGMQSRSAN